ncbi:hypothetical protein RvY_16356 [Ramazzottius varieornatus]|uniref:Uncharacterized protein n=1 Tax=Ramazzottius varieornatus TaxID=947166 RepID=A0A1D1VY55_RAMVA|nr:hypothetical protein RvY_16356 [Ramazzottius varieornatus]
MDGKDQHDGDFEQYRQHLAEVGWNPLWRRRLEGIMINAFKIWSGVFAGGCFTTKKKMPARSMRGQAKEVLLAPEMITVVYTSIAEELKSNFGTMLRCVSDQWPSQYHRTAAVLRYEAAACRNGIDMTHPHTAIPH